MIFEWSGESRSLKNEAYRFAKQSRRNDVISLDKSSTFPRELWDKYADFGAMGMNAPEEYGGTNLNFISLVAVMEGLGKGSNDSGLLFSINAHLWSCVELINRFGTENQKERYLSDLCSGKKIGAQAMTEPDSGSDAFNMTTECVNDGGNYVLNGSKIFTTNGHIADCILVFAKLTSETDGDSVCCFIVEKGTEGLDNSGVIEKMGLRTSPFCELFFNDCRVPKENMLGKTGAGKMIFTHSMDAERVSIMATQIGMMERQIAKCKAYALGRRQFGRPIYDNQAISHLLAEMKVNLESSRLLVYKVAYTLSSGRPAHLDSAIAKVHTSECLIKNCISAMRIHGGYGYTVEMELERELRDAMGSPFYSGTTEVMKNIIAELID